MSTPTCGRRACALLAAGVMASGAMTTPSLAAPAPRSDEWWFRSWSVQDKVWPLSKGQGVSVAVIDSGVNAKLPELSGAVLAGLDTTGGKTQGQVDFDKQGHGTSVSALIAAQGGGSTGYVGLAPEAKILPIRLPSDSAAGDNIDEIARGIRFAVDHGAKVINMSIGGASVQCASVLESAIDYAIGHDVVLVASAGNDGSGADPPEQPARCPGVLAVGAVTKAGRPWHDTQRQNYVTIAAPGAQMGLVGKDGTYYPDSRGTSGSAALVSAAVALIRSRNPSMSGRTVVQRVIATAMRVGDQKWNSQTGYGVLLVRGAMDPAKYPVPTNAPNPVYQAFDKWKQLRYGNPTPQTATAATKPKSTERSRGPKTSLVVAGVVAAVLVLVGLVAGLLLVSRRRRLDHTSHP